MSDKPYDFHLARRKPSVDMVISAVRPRFETDDADGQEMKKARIDMADELREFLDGNVGRQEGFAHAYDFVRATIASMLIEVEKDPSKLGHLKASLAYSIGEVEIPLYEAVTGERLPETGDPSQALHSVLNALKSMLDERPIDEAKVNEWPDGLDPEDA